MTAKTKTTRVATDAASYFDIQVDMPSFARTAAVLISCALVGTGMSFLADAVINVLAVSTLVVTGSTLAGWVIFWLGWVVALVTSFYAGAAVARYIVDRRVDRDWAALKTGATNLWGKVASKFGGEPEPSVTLH